MALPKKEGRYTFADCLALGEGERMELINGAPFRMVPPPRIHQQISMELSRQLANFLAGKCPQVYAAPFSVRLFERDGDRPEDVDTVVEPDITVVCDRRKLDEYGCKGAPDMVIEILSPSTRRRDRLVKLRLYQGAGVREYWIVSPEEQSVEVYLLEEGVMVLHEVYDRASVAKVNVLEGCFLELKEISWKTP